MRNHDFGYEIARSSPNSTFHLMRGCDVHSPSVVAAVPLRFMPAIAAFVRPGTGLRSGAARPRSWGSSGTDGCRAGGHLLALWRVAAVIAHLRRCVIAALGFDRTGVLLIHQHVARAECRSSQPLPDIVPRLRRFPSCGRCGERDDADCPRRSEPLPAGRRIRRTHAGQGASIAEFGVSQLFRHLWNAAPGGTGLPRR